VLIATIGTIATSTWIGMGLLIQRFYLKQYDTPLVKFSATTDSNEPEFDFL
jgi:hypothetical protein